MPTLGLSMIVRNEERSLRQCLESVSGIVQQMVIADTGSSDGTREIAKSFGATVLSIPWEDHFAKARNAALAPITSDWVLVLDADEEVDASAREKLPRMLQAGGDVGGYLTPIRNYVSTRFGRGWDRAAVPNDHRHPRAEKSPAFFTHENCRLFRRNPEIYFVSRVHELVEYRVHELGLKLRPSEFCIHHFGQLSEEEFKKHKAARYHRLLQLKVEDQPNDPAAWVQLGLEEYEGRKDAQQALLCFQKALALEPRAAQAWFFTGMIQLELGDYKAALSAFDRARGDDNNRAMLAHLRGDALHNLGQLDEARTAYLRALDLIPDDPILMSKLGFTEVRANRVQTGLDRLRRACVAAPDVAEIQERLMKAYIVIDNLPQAAEHAEIVAALENTPKWFLRAASVRLKLKQVDRAKEILRRAIERLPNVPELQDALTGLGTARSAADQS